MDSISASLNSTLILRYCVWNSKYRVMLLFLCGYFGIYSNLQKILKEQNTYKKIVHFIANFKTLQVFNFCLLSELAPSIHPKPLHIASHCTKFLPASDTYYHSRVPELRHSRLIYPPTRRSDTTGITEMALLGIKWKRRKTEKLFMKTLITCYIYYFKCMNL